MDDNKTPHDLICNSLLDHMEQAVIVLSNNLVVEAFNLQAEHLFSQYQEDVIGQDFYQVCERSGIHFPVSISSFKHSQPFYIVSQKIALRDNRQVRLEWKISLLKTEYKEVKGYLLIGYSIKDMPNQVSRNDLITYLDYVINNVPHFVFWKNTNLEFLGCNKAFAKSAGLNSPEDIFGKTDYDLPWTDKQSNHYRSDDMSIITTGIAKLNFEETQTQLDGSERVMLVSKVPMYDHQNKINGILGIYSDITERKKAEQELRVAKQKAESANQVKSNFLALVSHELRTPLNGILGTTQILAEKLSEVDNKEHVNDIQQSAIHLLTLVNEILDLSQLEAGKFIIRESSFNLKKVLQESLVDIKNRALKKNIKLIVLNDSEIPTSIVGDALRLRQILLNLVGNALKFTAKGKIQVIARLLSHADTQIRLKFEVIDTGIGIPLQMQQKIFERFSQVESKFNRSYEGVGLGLSICKQIVETMGGEIGLISEPGKGSTFWFEVDFKLIENQNEKVSQKLTNQIQKLPENFSANVLLVEDNQLNQKIAKLLLEELGCCVDLASSGDNALALLKVNEYEIVFMDIGLPDIDGLTVTKEIRKNEIYKRLPIIALTAHAMEDDVRRCFAFSMNDVLTKPVTAEALKSMLIKWVVAG